MKFLLTLLLAIALTASASTARARPFVIAVVDAQTGRGVPLVELETTNNVRYVTDSNGVVAFDEPGLFGQKVFFQVRSHGYELPKDGFGYRGKAFDVTDGGAAKLELPRVNIAERLYRVTGGGIYRDSVLAGVPVPIRQPVLNGLVFGSDSVVNAVYHGKLYWFWGDTNRPAYPLGNFQVTGAVSLLPSAAGLDPEAGIELTYFVDEKGFARGMAPLPGEGPTWIFGVVVLRDREGQERMFAHYVKVRGFLDVYEHGMARYDDAHERFEKLAAFPLDSAVRPGGQTFVHHELGRDYVYYAQPYPLTRVRAEPDALAEVKNFEAFTCLVAGSRLSDPKVDRDASGKPRYAWKRDTPVVGPAEQASLVKKGLLKPDEVLLPLRDILTDKAVQAHTGSVFWNAYRKRWVLIAVETGGTSLLGEVWYAEGDTPLGPWVYARKVVTHDRYSFYNPKQHPLFDKDGGRTILFEGTYTQMFSGNPLATPRYEYNQVMYKLTLTDARLNLPVPVYSGPGARYVTKTALDESGARRTIPFFALERTREGAVPVYAGRTEKGGRSLEVGAQGQRRETKPNFYALPVTAKEPPAGTVPLYEYPSVRDGDSVYSTEQGRNLPGYRFVEHPICRVWRNPSNVDFAAE